MSGRDSRARDDTGRACSLSSPLFFILLLLLLPLVQFQSAACARLDGDRLIVSEDCGAGRFSCYGECTTSGGNENTAAGMTTTPFEGEVDFVEVLKNGTALSIQIKGGLDEDFEEHEICHRDVIIKEKFSCLTVARNDIKTGVPQVQIDLVYESCDEWTKIVRNYGGGEGEDGQTIAPAICAVQCVRNEN